MMLMHCVGGITFLFTGFISEKEGGKIIYWISLCHCLNPSDNKTQLQVASQILFLKNLSISLTPYPVQGDRE